MPIHALVACWLGSTAAHHLADLHRQRIEVPIAAWFWSNDTLSDSSKKWCAACGETSSGDEGLPWHAANHGAAIAAKSSR